VTTRADGKTNPATGYPVPAATAASPGPAPVVRTAAASRRINRRLLVLSVLVVLLGGLVAFVAGQMLTEHTEVLAMARTVAVGSTIRADDLATANVTSDPHLSPIPASQRERIVGMVAQVALSPGELLTRSQVGPGTGFAPGQMLVALPRVVRGDLAGQVGVAVARGELVQRHHERNVARTSATSRTACPASTLAQ
jgi:SAF domain